MAIQPDSGRFMAVLIGAGIFLALLWLGGEFFFK
jgi:hypothetical protein